MPFPTDTLPPDQPPTVYVVDDDPGARASVCALVSSMGIQAAAYASAEEFLEAFDIETPGCLVTDVRMMGISGVQLQERLRERRIKLPVIVITAYADTQVTVKAMRNGAITLLEKPCREQELWDSIREALEADALAREQWRRRADVAARIDSLSPQEREVMEQMVEGKANKVIATQVGVSVRTVEARRHNVFEKTRTDSLAELVSLVLEYRGGAEGTE